MRYIFYFFLKIINENLLYSFYINVNSDAVEYILETQVEFFECSHES